MLSLLLSKQEILLHPPCNLISMKEISNVLVRSNLAVITDGARELCGNLVFLKHLPKKCQEEDVTILIGFTEWSKKELKLKPKRQKTGSTCIKSSTIL